MPRLLRLHEEVELHMGGSRCPCCLRPMTKPAREKKGKPRRQPNTDRSMGHVYNSRHDDHRDVWYWQCRQCNHHQAGWELLQWARILVHRRDDRAKAVVELCKVVYGWLEARGRRVWSKQDMAAFTRSKHDDAGTDEVRN